MATDTRKDQQLTLADLCEAIAEGQVPFTLSDGAYQVSHRELRRELRRLRDQGEARETIPVELLADASQLGEMDLPC
jgi:hypothetical protein